MKLEMETYDRFVIQNSSITNKEIKKINKSLEALSVEERKKIKGLQPKRADIILAGSMVVEHVLENLELEEMYISDFDNLEGCLKDKLINASEE